MPRGLYGAESVSITNMERARRGKAMSEKCQHCNDNDVITGEGGAHDFRIIGNTIYYYDSNFGWEGEKINCCPWCGRKLQEKQK